MLRSDDFFSVIDDATPSEKVAAVGVIIELYSGAVADRLVEAGFLNFLVRDREKGCRIVTVHDVQTSGVDILDPQTGINASVVVGTWVEDLALYAQHWEGFESSFDIRSMRLTGQRFTK